MKNRYFSNALRNHKLEGVKNKTLCDDSSILVRFKKIILKWAGVPDFWEGQVEIRAKSGKWSFSQGLSREFFQVVPDT